MIMDTDILEALARLESSEPLVVDWLKSRLRRHEQMMATSEADFKVRWAQGRVQELRDQIEEIEKARASLDRIARR